VADIDELRQRLRALGYLDAGVDRFVLGSAARAKHPAGIALMASGRIGILAAALLGPTAAIALVAQMPGLVTGARDAAVATVYLGILFGALATAAAFLASLATSWMAARTAGGSQRAAKTARILAITAGVVVTAACLAYLTLWWKTASSSFAWSSPVWTTIALAIVAAISVMLGHAVAVTALVVTMARPGHDVFAARVPGATWKASIAGVVISFAGAALLLFVAARAERARDRAPVPLPVVRSEPVVLLAIDGFDPQLRSPVRPTTAPSYTLFPILDAARAQLRAVDSGDPARLWTTIATGMRPEAHGVGALETRQVTGLRGRLAAGSTGRVIGAATDLLRLTRPAIASNFERRVKTFWEIAEQAGLRTAVINWWATWPAPADSGIVLSDRAVLRLERGGPLDAEIAPAALYETLRARWPDIRSDARQRAQSYFSSPGYAEDREILTRSGELDVSMLQIAEDVSRDQKLDLLVIYLPGLDIAQHALLRKDGGTSSAFELNQRLTAIQGYYEFLESQAGPAMERWHVGRQAFVVAQPGRVREGQGTLAALGTGLKLGARAHGAIVDMAPTILYALGVPIARNLDGRVIEALFEPAFLASHPVRFVDTYGQRGAISAIRGGTPLDQEVIDRLRSLGYVR
jgi:hypothetical protein